VLEIVAIVLIGVALLVVAGRGLYRLWSRGGVDKSVAILVGGGVLLVAIGLGLPETGMPLWLRNTVDLMLVAAFSALVAYGELVSRYRDSPARLFGTLSTSLYLLTNIAGGIAALLIVHKLQVFTDASAKAPRLYAILLAGFAAVAFFRSSLFTMRVGGSDMGVGPSALLQSLLAATDREINRSQAKDRGNSIKDIMRDIDFAKAQLALPSLCFTLVENITAEEQKGLSDQIKSLASSDLSGEQKSVLLGAYLIRQVGANVLKVAVGALRQGLTTTTPGPTGATGAGATGATGGTGATGATGGATGATGATGGTGATGATGGATGATGATGGTGATGAT